MRFINVKFRCAPRPNRDTPLLRQVQCEIEKKWRKKIKKIKTNRSICESAQITASKTAESIDPSLGSLANICGLVDVARDTAKIKCHTACVLIQLRFWQERHCINTTATGIVEVGQFELVGIGGGSGGEGLTVGMPSHPFSQGLEVIDLYCLPQLLNGPLAQLVARTLRIRECVRSWVRLPQCPLLSLMRSIQVCISFS